MENITDIKDDQEKIYELFSKLRNSSDEYFEWALNYFIQNNQNLYDPEKRRLTDKKLEFTEDFKIKCLLLDEFVYDTTIHDDFAISLKYLEHHFQTQDFRNKITDYEQKDKIEFKMPLDIKVRIYIN